VYGKIFEEIFDSSLMSYGWVHTYTFMSMIVIADKDGYVKLDPRALYRKIGFDVDDRVSFDEFMSAIERLGEEDDLSNLPYYNGRRIIPLHELECVGNRGWWIVNYKHYRDKGGSIEKRREQDAARKRRQREREAGKDECHVTVTQGHVMSAHTDTDTDITKVSGKMPYKKIIDYLNSKAGTNYRPSTKATQRFIRARFNEGFTLDDFYTVISHKCREWKTDSKMVQYLRPETLFGTKFESYLQKIKPEETKKVFVA
jgi:uncharacterized phage protein (TIGR02220 family)